jgi:hypothetical protein
MYVELESDMDKAREDHDVVSESDEAELAVVVVDDPDEEDVLLEVPELILSSSVRLS